MIESIGAGLLTLAVVLDTASYWRQIAKTLRTGKSRHVSTTTFIFRLAKDVCLLGALGIYENWVGFSAHVLSLLTCTITLIVVAKHKPKGWRLLS